jgi:FdhE protein
MPLQRNDQDRWDQRIERAKELGKDYPAASTLLAFYEEIATFQKSLAAGLSAVRVDGDPQPENVSFRDALDLTPLLPNFPSLLSLVKRVGPPPLAEAAEELAQTEREYWEHLLSTYWRAENHVVDGAPETHLFFARVFLQPYAEYVASKKTIELPRFNSSSTCPVCGGKPLVGVLREESHGAKRSLVCSLCLTEWDYRRVLCPACGEKQFDALPVYTASQFEHVRVEACDTCKTYIKTVDLTKNGLAIPVVDELATVPLSLWAEEKGYTKLEPNLLGI